MNNTYRFIKSVSVATFIILSTAIAYGMYIPAQDDNGGQTPSTAQAVKTPDEATSKVRGADYAPDQFIVKFKPQAGEQIVTSAYNATNSGAISIDTLNKKHKVKTIEPVFKRLHSKNKGGKATKAAEDAKMIAAKFPERAKRAPKDAEIPDLENIYLLKTEPGVNIMEAIEEYKKDPNVEYAQPDYKVEVQMAPNDPYYQDVYAGEPGHRPPGEWDPPHDYLYGLKPNKLNCEQAWDISEGEGVIVAVIDTGVDYNHEDIAANMWNDGQGHYGYDFVNNDNNPMDDHGHGTHCAGTIAAVGNNNIGVIGVAPMAKIMAVKGLNSGGSGNSSKLAQCIDYAVANGAHILSNSWGGSGTAAQALIDAFTAAHTAGCVSVAAAGNNNGDVAYFNPANINSVIAVAASDNNDAKASFSNWGAKIDIAAPGVDILSLRAAGTSMGSPVGNGYTRADGTSMACPHAAGTVAVILSNHPAFNSEQIRQVLRISADDILEPGWDMNSGYGRLNVFEALQLHEVSVAKIAYPCNNSELKGVIEITGTASGQSYVVKYGNGSTPQTWTDIGAGGTVNDGILAEWDTARFPNGNGTIMLVVDGIFIDRVFLNIRNVIITSPNNDDWLRAGDALAITGTASGPSFQHYGIEYREVGGSTWLTDGVSLTNGGSQPVLNGELATWDTSYITRAGYYEIRLTVYNIDFSSSDTRQIYFDPALNRGWPIKITGTANEAAQYFPAICDINNDGLQEIIIIGSEHSWIYRPDGRLLDGWPPAGGGFGGYTSGGFLGAPALGDIDGDGTVEIVTGSARGIKVYESNGVCRRYFDNLGWVDTVVLADIDNDGRLDVIFSSLQNLYVAKYVNGSLILMSGWPQVVPGIIKRTLAVGDVDADGGLEIVVAFTFSNIPQIYIFDKSGVVKQRISFESGKSVETGPFLVDLDGDGDLEIGLTYRDLRFVHHDGSYVQGWPYRYRDQSLFYNIWEGPVIGDLDKDGSPEIVSGRYSKWPGYTMMVALEPTGEEMAGWPTHFRQDPSFTSSIIGDINGDGEPEVITPTGPDWTTSDRTRCIYFFDKSGTQVRQPIALPNGSFRETVGVALGDIDNDGMVELVAVTTDFNNKGMIFAWDLDGVYDPRTMEWPTAKHDNQRTNCYSPHPSNRPPIAHWTFDEASGNVAHDSSGNGYDGLLYDGNVQGNGPAWITGRHGNALQFDGTNDHVRIPANASLNLSTKTVAMWARIDTLKTYYNALYGDQNNNYTAFTDKGTLYIWWKSPLSSASCALTKNSAAAPQGEWAFYAFVYDVQGMNVTVSAYKNGVAIAQTTSTRGLTPYQIITLGARKHKTDAYSLNFSGAIDDVRIYDKALSAQEIMDVYNGTK